MELLNQLQNDPDYQQKHRAAEAERLARERELRQAQKPLIEALHKVGVDIQSVWDLVNTSKPYPDALPVLMEHLERGGYPERVMEGLGRALAVKSAVVFWERLSERWLSARDAGEEDGTAVALAACATKSQVEDLIGFLRVEKRGDSRIYFLRPILQHGGQHGRKVVESLTGDPVFAKEATALLKRRVR